MNRADQYHSKSYRFKDLKGHAFRYKNLKGTDFGGADIRGADFSQANLENANFENSVSGIRPVTSRYLHGIVFLSIVLVFFAVAGLTIIINTPSVHSDYKQLSENSTEIQIAVNTIIPLIAASIMVFRIYRNGFSIKLLSYLLGIFISVILMGIVADTVSKMLEAIALHWILKLVFIIALFATLFLAEVSLSLFYWLSKDNTDSRNYIACSVLAVFLGILAAYSAVPQTYNWEYALNGMSVFVLCISSMKSALRLVFSQDQRNSFARHLVCKFCALWGTKFSLSNLTGANFQSSMISHTDFQKATLVKTNWFQSQGLERSYLEGTYLVHTAIRYLVVARRIKDQWRRQKGQLSFVNMDLRGVNFNHIDLSEVDFSGADLSEASLKGANLAEVNFRRVKLYGAELNGAHLTGACIQDWGISKETRLENIECKYVFMRCSIDGKAFSLRKPDDEKDFFGKHEFSKFMSPIVSTIGYYHEQYTDPRYLDSFDLLDFYLPKNIDSDTLTLAFVELAVKHPELEIDVLNIDYRSGERVKVKVFAKGKEDCSSLYSEYRKICRTISKMSPLIINELLNHTLQKNVGLNTLRNSLDSINEGYTYYSEIKQRLFDVSFQDFGFSKTILFLLTNPKDTGRLALDREVRTVKEKLSQASQREQFKLVTQEAIRAGDLIGAFIKYRPNIVHFSGHGTAEGLALENESGYAKMVSKEALADLFDFFKDRVECVVLNACYSEEQAKSILKFIPYVIGMKSSIEDSSAIVFSSAFYSYLGEGFNIRDAFDLSLKNLALEDMKGTEVPSLAVNSELFTKKKRVQKTEG